jgi:hypothetical protein
VNTLIATDLDRTMIFSRAASALAPSSAPEGPVCVELYNDAPLSFMAPGAVAKLGALAVSTPVVPTTTRTRAQFERITLPGGPFPYAVVSNGGRIVHDGENSTEWRTALEARIATTSVPVAELHADLQARIDESWVSSTRIADDLFAYLVVDLDRQPADFVDDWRAWCTPRGWSVSQQGRKIYAMPDGVTKSAAVAEVRRRLVDDGVLTSDAPLLAAGDGQLDADLLEYADHAIRPAHGELHDSGWTRPGITVTRSAGIEAGEEILDWFADHVHNPASSPHPLRPALAEK